MITIAELRKAAHRLQGHTEVHGLPISIENRRGSVRRWKTPNGDEGKTKMQIPYGYIRGIKGADGDSLDVFVGPKKDSKKVFVVNQRQKGDFRKFDEHKVLLGFESEEEARKAYLAHYTDDKFLGSVTEMTVEEFKKWIARKRVKAPIHKSGGPFIGPRGGKWADPKHTIHWEETQPKSVSSQVEPGDRLAGLPKEEFRKEMEEKGLSLQMHRGTSTKEDPGTKWLASSRATAERYAREGGVVSTQHVRMRKPYVASNVEIINASSGMIDRLRAQGYDGIVAQWSGGIPTKSNPHPRKEIWAVAFPPFHPETEQKRAVLRKVQRRKRGQGGHVSLTKDELKVILDDGRFALLSAGPNPKLSAHKGMSEEEKKKRHEELRKQLVEDGYTFTEVVGHYEDIEDSFLVMAHDVKRNALRHLGERFKQDSIIYADKGRQEMHYTTGEHHEKNECEEGAGWEEKPDAKDVYTLFPHPDGSHTKFALNFDWGKFVQCKKSLTIADLQLLKATVARPPGSGWQAIPRGRKGGFRRRRGRDWEYWYPTLVVPRRAHVETGREVPWGEADLKAGKFDKDAAHWGFYRKYAGRPPIGWVEGGVNPKSWHPVKEAGFPEKLYQITNPEVDPGWARVRDVATGKEKSLRHELVFPVEYLRAKKPQVSKPSELVKPIVKEPTKVKGKPARVVRLPSFPDSVALKGTALFKMEHGYFPMKTVRVRRRFANGEMEVVKKRRVEVDNATKQQLLTEFDGMITNVAKRVKSGFGLRSSWMTREGGRDQDQTMVELRSAAMEGFLHAIDSYPGAMPFAKHAQFLSREYARMHAAREFAGGIGMSRRHARLLRTFIAARAQAARALEKDDPSPREVAQHWKILKRDLHEGLGPQGSEPIPLKPYKLKADRVKVDDTGKRAYLYRDTVTQPGKLEMAERYHKFLTGQTRAEGSDFLDDSPAVLPAVHIGVGLSAEDKVIIRNQLERALSGLKEWHVFSPGRRGQRTVSYKANTAEILRRVLGLGGDGQEQSTNEVARHVPIYRREGDGEWKRLGDRQARTMIGEFLSQGLSEARARLGDRQAGKLLQQAEERLLPVEVSPKGPTYAHILEARSRTFTPEQVGEWRKRERVRLARLTERLSDGVLAFPEGPDRDHARDRLEAARAAVRRVDRMGEREVRMRLAQQTAPESAIMRYLATRTVEVEADSPGFERGWAVITITDPTTGHERRVRMRTFKDLRDPENREDMLPGGHDYRKSADSSDTVPTSGMLREALHFPELTRLLWSSDDPLAEVSTQHRYAVECMAGVM